MYEAIADYIARTNLFNFIIFAGIITYLVIKLNVKEGLEKGKEAVSEHIEDSDAAKKESEENLQSIKDKIENLESEIDQIVKESENNAKIVGEKIISDANKTAENIKNNSLKIIDNKTALLRNDIMKRASLASVEVAKNHIINELNSNADLHNKFIEESIEAINGVDIK